MSYLATSQMSIFWLVPVADETGLNLTLSETPKTGSSRDEAQIICVI